MIIALKGDHIPPEVVELARLFFFTVAVIALGSPLIRAFTRRWDRSTISDKPSAEISGRLERIEQAVEAVAIEVERIAEAQRFSAKLMSEQQQRSLPKSDAAR
jgi:hypothetical protein